MKLTRNRRQIKPCFFELSILHNSVFGKKVTNYNWGPDNILTEIYAIDILRNFKAITMLVIENKSKVGKTDKVWLTRGQSVDFEAFEKGQRIKAWVSDAYVKLTGIPQVIATKIEVIP